MKKDKMLKSKNDILAEKVFGKFEDFYGKATPRLGKYKEAAQWMAGDESLVWIGERQLWKPNIFPNLLESNVRQKVSLLTDSKPKIYVYTIPEIELIDNDKHIELLKMHSVNMNMAFDHLWRVNKMQTELEVIVIRGAQTGLMAGRCYWDKAEKEIKTAALHPGCVFFDEAVTSIDVLDGSTEWLVLGYRKPRSWFRHYFGVSDFSDAAPMGYQDISQTSNVSEYPVYIECYRPVGSLEVDYLGEEKDPEPGVMVTGLCGNKLVYNRRLEGVFPCFFHPYELDADSPFGQGDVMRLSTIQKDFCSKVAQVSLNIALSANRQWIMNPAKLGMKLKELIAHIGEPGYIYVTKRLAEDVKNAIVDLETPKFNPELFQYLYFLPQLMEQISGVTKLMQGLAAKTERQSKYEIGKQYEAGTIRIRNVAHHIEMMLVDMGRIWAKMINQHYIDPRRIYRIDEMTDELKTNLFQMPVNPEGKPFDFDYVVVVQPDTVLPVDLQSQAERDMLLLEKGMIDPRTLLESLNHPKVNQIIQRLQERDQQQAQMKQGAQMPVGPATPATPAAPAAPKALF
jgi:hypothetical protein